MRRPTPSAADLKLLDPDGAVGHAYNAKTTPQIFIIDRGGRLAYQGAMDDKPTMDATDIKTAKNYVVAALAAIGSEKPVTEADTRPYGCPIKYKN